MARPERNSGRDVGVSSAGSVIHELFFFFAPLEFYFGYLKVFLLNVYGYVHSGVATGWGNEGDWVVCIPEQCSGYFDAAEATLTGAIVCTDADTTGTTGRVNAGGCDGHTGFHDGGYVDFQNENNDRAMFTLSGCAAGPASIVFKYASGTSMPQRPMELLVNGADQGSINFGPTGGWDSGQKTQQKN